MKSIPGVFHLEHSSADIQLERPDNDGHIQDLAFRVFGSPYSPDRLSQNWAFQYAEEDAEDLWDAVPGGLDVLVTHTPPASHCDTSRHWTEGGCSSLKQALRRVKPALHICGHCHEGRGGQVVRWGEGPGSIESVRAWEDPGVGKKQSLFDLTGGRGGQALDVGKETAIVNASVMAKSWGRGSKAFNKPIVVDVNFPIRKEDDK